MVRLASHLQLVCTFEGEGGVAGGKEGAEGPYEPTGCTRGTAERATRRAAVSSPSSSCHRGPQLTRTSTALLAGNPHILRPTLRDFDPRPPAGPLTFVPPPPSFPRSLVLPSIDPPTLNPLSTSNGQFSLSLKGVRRTLLRLTGPIAGLGGPTESLIRLIESELLHWLSARSLSDFHSTSTILDPTPFSPLPNSSSPEPTLTELSRTPSSLLWALPDPHARFITHVLARYYALPSFSKPRSPTDPTRVTWILRPQLVRPRVGEVDTPPMTEMSGSEVSSEVSSEVESGSEGGWEEVGAWEEELEGTKEESSEGGTDDEASSGAEDLAASIESLPRTTTMDGALMAMEGASTPRPATGEFGTLRAGWAVRNVVREEGGMRTPVPRGRTSGGVGERERASSEESLVRESPRMVGMVKVRKGEWKMPERRFVEFLFGEKGI